MSKDNLILQIKQNAKKSLKILGCDSVEFINFPDNRLDSLDLLDVVKRIEGFIDAYKPYTIITHYEHDLNIDHQITYNAVITSFRPLHNETNEVIFTFETLSSTEWRPPQENISFEPNYFI